MVEVRSVNQRHCEVRIDAPRDLAALLPDIEKCVRDRVARGRIELSIRLCSDTIASSVPRVDVALAKRYKEAVDMLKTTLQLAGEVTLEMLWNAPGVVRAREETRDVEAVRGSIFQATESALSELDGMKQKEGAALATSLEAILNLARLRTSELRAASGRAHADRKQRAMSRMRELLGDAAIEGGRALQEVALAVERADVTEEIDRLECHLQQCAAAMTAPGSVGRRLEFILQEMSREANTLGSKCADVCVGSLVIDLKSELERMREQVQNVE